MDFDRYTEKTRSYFQKAQTLALRSSHQSLEPEHLLKVMLEEDDRFISNILQTADADKDKLLKDLNTAIAKFPKVEGPGAGGLRISNDLAKILDQAITFAEKSGDKFVTGERILQAMLMAKATNVQDVLERSGLTSIRLNQAISLMA